MTSEIALRTIEELERIHGYKIDAILPDGTHRSWPTHCRHDRHEACSADRIQGVNADMKATRYVRIERTPARCKTCLAPCVCPCGHGAAVSDG